MRISVYCCLASFSASRKPQLVIVGLQMSCPSPRSVVTHLLKGLRGVVSSDFVASTRRASGGGPRAV